MLPPPNRTKPTVALTAPPNPRWHLGLDLGQRQDYCALAAVALTWTADGRDPATRQCCLTGNLIIRCLIRFPFGTSYHVLPDLIAGRLAQIDRLPRPHQLSGLPPKDLIIDGNGPGPPVVDSIRARLADRATIRPVISTSGRGQTALHDGYTGLPRPNLISNLMLMMTGGGLRA